MRNLICFFFFTLSGSAFAQKADTVFLKREIRTFPSYQYYHAVFIDTTDKFRKQLVDFSFLGYDSSTYYSSLENIESIEYGWFNQCQSFPRRWIAAYKLKEKFYLYYPSDFGNHYTFEITDSTIITHSMEGPIAGKSVLVKCNAPRHVEINFTMYGRKSKLNIEVFDLERGLAIFEFSDGNREIDSYRVLMVDASKANKFPTVVNYCETEKTEEFEFDNIGDIVPKQ